MSRIARPPDWRDPGQIPFTSDWSDRGSFADIKASPCLTDLAGQLDGWTSTLNKTTRGFEPEAEVGDWNTVQAGLLDILSRARRAVARIVVPGGLTDYRGVRQERGWTGTGFLVGPNLLLTNHHVLNDTAAAAAATVEFDYEVPGDKLLAGGQTTEPPAVRFELTPTRLFVTSPLRGGLDYSFVWITEKAAERFGTIRMERGSFLISPYEPVFIIHHPKGRLKEVSLDDTEVLGVNAVNILYAADTDYGSSGACVFNRNGRLVALHHARQAGAEIKANYPDAVTQLEDRSTVSVANEGVKISAIAVDLELRMRSASVDANSAAEVLDGIVGSDSLTGIFGAIGREGAARPGVEGVRGAYRSADGDADIAFWNMRWLMSASGATVGTDDAVTAMADLRQDAWILTDVPPMIVDRLAKGLRDRFRDEVEVAFGEADARLRQFATAVIWRPATISCARLSWPAQIADAFARPVPELEGNHPLFPTPPGLFRLGPRCKPGCSQAMAWQVNVSPIGSAGGRSESVARRLASRLLVRAVAQTDVGADWIVVGDGALAMAKVDARPLLDLGYRMMAAVDRRRGGALTYLRAPTSGMRNAFVTSDLSIRDNDLDFIEVVAGRSVDAFIGRLAGSRPAVLRLAPEQGSGMAAEERIGALGGVGPVAPPFGDWAEGLSWQGLDKRRFLAANRSRLAALVAEADARQRAEYPDLSPLTELDLWVVTFAEAGLGAAGVDPAFRHSNGEIGLYPLPNNIAYWIGPAAPAWDRPMPIETNIESYALYLGQIRNKSVSTVGIGKLYRDLFRAPGIADFPERQARLLAGVVHGYFVRSNYQNGVVPFDRILSGYVTDEPVDSILDGTGYVHAGTSILTNRQRNIDAGVAAFREESPAASR